MGKPRTNSKQYQAQQKARNKGKAMVIAGMIIMAAAVIYLVIEILSLG